MDMESKPVMIFTTRTGVMDIPTSSQSKEGFIGEYVTGDNVTYTKKISSALGVETDDEILGLIVPVTNIPDLVHWTKAYLKANGIGFGHFASEVLNVNSPFFASMCSQKAGHLNKKWNQLSPKMQVCYSRMAFWMEKVANPATPVTPLAEETAQRKGKGKAKGKGQGNPKKPRTLLLDGIRRKHSWETGSLDNSIYYIKHDRDADGKAKNTPEAIVEEKPMSVIGIGEYFAGFKEDEFEIMEVDVTVIQIEVDEGNDVTYAS